jgi:hypothetical protein
LLTFLNLIDCDSVLNAAATKADDADCNMACNGNSSEFCGGPNRLNLYNYTGTDLPTNPGDGGGGGGGDGGGTGTPVFPVLTGLPTGWAYNACWV